MQVHNAEKEKTCVLYAAKTVPRAFLLEGLTRLAGGPLFGRVQERKGSFGSRG